MYQVLSTSYRFTTSSWQGVSFHSQTVAHTQTKVLDKDIAHVNKIPAGSENSELTQNTNRNKKELCFKNQTMTELLGQSVGPILHTSIHCQSYCTLLHVCMNKLDNKAGIPVNLRWVPTKILLATSMSMRSDTKRKCSFSTFLSRIGRMASCTNPPTGTRWKYSLVSEAIWKMRQTEISNTKTPWSERQSARPCITASQMLTGSLLACCRILTSC